MMGINLNKYGKFKYDPKEVQYICDVANLIHISEPEDLDFKLFINKYMNNVESNINIICYTIILNLQQHKDLTIYDKENIYITF